MVFNGGQYLSVATGMPSTADFSKVAVYSYFDSILQNPIIGSLSTSSNRLYMGGTNYMKLWNNSNFLTSNLAVATSIPYAVSMAFLQVSPTRTGTLYRSNISGGNYRFCQLKHVHFPGIHKSNGFALSQKP